MTAETRAKRPKSDGDMFEGRVLKTVVKRM
jgi:hypothetical protein